MFDAFFDVIRIQRFELKQMTAGTDGRIDRMIGIGGSGTDQDDRTVLHMRQQQILLVLVETVDLITDQDQGT